MRDMGMASEELEKQARSLSTEEKATLARILIEELDTAIDPNGLKRRNVVMKPVSHVSLRRAPATR